MSTPDHNDPRRIERVYRAEKRSTRSGYFEPKRSNFEKFCDEVRWRNQAEQLAEKRKAAVEAAKREKK